MITFNNIKFKNFLSYGNDFTEINLTDAPMTVIVGANGHGKSTIIEALCYGLFGKSYSGKNIPSLINNLNKNNMLVEINFTIGSVNFLIRRGIKPNIFEIYSDDQLIKQTASPKDYQRFIEENILKLNFKSFKQVVVAGSGSFIPFMMLPAALRREVVEDILDIKIFSTMNILLKTKISENRLNTSKVENDILLLEDKINFRQVALNNKENNNEQKVLELRGLIDTLVNEINEIKNLNNELESNIKLIDSKLADWSDVKVEIANINQQLSNNNKEKKVLAKEIKFYDENSNCPTCNREIDKAFKVSSIDKLKSRGRAILKNTEEISQKKIDLDSKNVEFMKLSKEKDALNNQIYKNNVDIKSKIDYKERIEKELTDMNDDDAQSLKNEISELSNSLILKMDELNKLKIEKSIQDSAFYLLKDSGIKTTIINQYIPVINKIINKNLSELDFFATFELDNSFSEKICSRLLDNFQYVSFSQGERMRIDLAILLAWREIAKVKNSVNTNLLILDEVLDASLDNEGCDLFLKLLKDLSRDTNILVISHKGDKISDNFNRILKVGKYKKFSSIQEQS